MNQEKETEILEMYDSGMKIAAIADEMELSPTAVRNILKRSDRDLVVHKVSHDEEAIIEQYIQGTAIQTILADHDLTYSVLYGILSKHKVASRKVANESSRQQRFDTAVQMYQDGFTLWKITSETGIAQPTLHAELHKRDVPLRRDFTRAGVQSIDLKLSIDGEEIEDE